jgi:concanavalin A-like lectin/glucanase superfamily protein
MRFAGRRAVPAIVLTFFGLLGTSATSAVASCPASSPDAYSRAVLSDAPIAYYRLDELSGPTLCDSSSSAANGTYKTTGVALGVPGALLSSPDTAARVASPSAGVGDGGSGLTGNHSFTLEGWVRSTGTDQTQVLVDMGTGGTGHIAGLGVTNQSSGSSVLLDTFNGVVYWPTGAVNLYDQQWHYVAVTYDQVLDQVTAYLDGKNLGPKASSHPLNLGASNIRLGWWIDTFFNQPFVGDMDEIAVYPSALSPARVQAHFAASRPGAPGAAANPKNSFVIMVPRITCAGICHVILVAVRVLGPGSVVVEESLPAGATSLAGVASKHTRRALLKVARVAVLSAGTVAVKLKLTAAGTKLLQTRRRLALKLKVTFTPRGGTAISKTTSFTLRS